MEDWRGVVDMLRCNYSFHNRARHDIVLVNTTSASELTFALLFALLRCQFHRKVVDRALVSVMKTSRWQPNTPWDGCVLREVVRESHLRDPGTFIRGAHLIPIDVPGKGVYHCLNDFIDVDWFLHAGN